MLSMECGLANIGMPLTASLLPWRVTMVRLLALGFVATVRHFPSLRRSRLIIETVGAFANESAADESLESAQRAMIFGCRETQRVPNRVCSPGAADAMNVILGMFWKVIIDDV
jgi:hypothetical protein